MRPHKKPQQGCTAAVSLHSTIRLAKPSCQFLTTRVRLKSNISAIPHQLSSELTSINPIIPPSGNPICNSQCCGCLEESILIHIRDFPFENRPLSKTRHGFLFRGDLTLELDSDTNKLAKPTSLTYLVLTNTTGKSGCNKTSSLFFSWKVSPDLSHKVANKSLEVREYHRD